MVKKIQAFLEGEKIKQKLLIKHSNKGMTAKGAPYLNLVFQDDSGNIEGKKWDVSEEEEMIFKIGNIVEVEGDVLKYKNSLQLRVNGGILISPTESDPTDFIKKAPQDRKTMQKELFEYIEGIKNKNIKLIVDEIIKENYLSFSTFPAATTNHHEYASGLLYHTLSMLKLADALCQLYPSINRDLLIGGVILHDVGKTKELSGPLVPKYTVEGNLIGHISIIQADIANIAKKHSITGETPVLLQHMVLSHHGKKAFGSPIEPLIKEAEILSFIDNLDSKINIIERELAEINEGEFTKKIYPLEDRSFYKPIKEK